MATEFDTPHGSRDAAPTFATSQYGADRGSTCVWGGKGLGKGGKHHTKGQPKKKAATVQEGREDPEVL